MDVRVGVLVDGLDVQPHLWIRQTAVAGKLTWFIACVLLGVFLKVNIPGAASTCVHALVSGDALVHELVLRDLSVVDVIAK